MTKRDAQTQLEKELDGLLQTTKDEELRSFQGSEMARFAALFGRFLQEEGPSVEWDKIQKLPTEAVKDYATLRTPSENSVGFFLLEKLILRETVTIILILFYFFIFVFVSNNRWFVIIWTNW